MGRLSPVKLSILTLFNLPPLGPTTYVRSYANAAYIYSLLFSAYMSLPCVWCAYGLLPSNLLCMHLKQGQGPWHVSAQICYTGQAWELTLESHFCTPLNAVKGGPGNLCTDLVYRASIGADLGNAGSSICADVSGSVAVGSVDLEPLRLESLHVGNLNSMI